eukprot:9488115-Pyramimonas_sp.AAC.1
MKRRRIPRRGGMVMRRRRMRRGGEEGTEGEEGSRRAPKSKRGSFRRTMGGSSPNIPDYMLWDSDVPRGEEEEKDEGTDGWMNPRLFGELFEGFQEAFSSLRIDATGKTSLDRTPWEFFGWDRLRGPVVDDDGDDGAGNAGGDGGDGDGGRSGGVDDGGDCHDKENERDDDDDGGGDDGVNGGRRAIVTSHR